MSDANPRAVKLMRSVLEVTEPSLPAPVLRTPYPGLEKTLIYVR